MDHVDSERKQVPKTKTTVICQNELIYHFSNEGVTASVLKGSPKNECVKRKSA